MGHAQASAGRPRRPPADRDQRLRARAVGAFRFHEARGRRLAILDLSRPRVDPLPHQHRREPAASRGRGWRIDNQLRTSTAPSSPGFSAHRRRVACGRRRDVGGRRRRSRAGAAEPLGRPGRDLRARQRRPANRTRLLRHRWHPPDRAEVRRDVREARPVRAASPACGIRSSASHGIASASISTGTACSRAAASAPAATSISARRSGWTGSRRRTSALPAATAGSTSRSARTSRTRRSWRSRRLAGRSSGFGFYF